MTCIDDDTIARIVAHTLAEGERAVALAHLETCDDCRSLVAASMQLADETRTIAVVSSSRETARRAKHATK